MTHRLPLLIAAVSLATGLGASSQASATFPSRGVVNSHESGPLGPAWWGWSGPGWGYVGPGGGRGWVGNGWGWRGANGYAAPTYVSGSSCRRWTWTARGWTKIPLC
jgi:hypothetical protein